MSLGVLFGESMWPNVHVDRANDQVDAVKIDDDADNGSWIQMDLLIEIDREISNVQIGCVQILEYVDGGRFQSDSIQTFDDQWRYDRINHRTIDVNGVAANWQVIHVTICCD